MDREGFLQFLGAELAKLKEEGLFKEERPLRSPQQALVTLADGSELINLCANNYLGLADHPSLIKVAQEALARYGYGLSSVRFICGTQTIHKELEGAISHFLGMEDTLLYSSCFDANAGLFETLLGAEDAVISDALNHASIIDGIRLCKAQRLRYANNDMKELEKALQQTKDCRLRLIATDGVFSMDGMAANLPAICDLAERYQALVMVDDSHAVGVLGEHGRGTAEHYGVSEGITLTTGTLGKALGGASGGYTSGPKEIIAWLRQRSRPYLFSNTLAPVIAATSLQVFKLLEGAQDLRLQLQENTRYFRRELSALGFKLIPGEHPIIPVMIGDAKLAAEMAKQLFKLGIYVVSFSYPVVPLGAARLRIQISAAHEKAQLDRALSAFAKVGQALGVRHESLG